MSSPPGSKCLSIIFLGYKVKYVLISSRLSRPRRQADRQPVGQGHGRGEVGQAEAVILIMIILTLISVANLCTIWLIDWRCLHSEWQRSTQTAQNTRSPSLFSSSFFSLSLSLTRLFSRRTQTNRDIRRLTYIL